MSEIVVTPERSAEMFLRFGNGAARAMLSAAKASATFMAARTISTKLENKNPPYLNRRKGNLIRNVAASPYARAVSTNEVEAGFGTNSDYGIPLEEGYKGIVTVRAHMRKRLGAIRAVDIRTREATKRARVTLAQRQAGPISVKEHERDVDIRARHYLLDTLNENAGKPGEFVNEAFDQLLVTGNPPSGEDLLRTGG
jgi:hypothetical protein